MTGNEARLALTMLGMSQSGMAERMRELTGRPITRQAVHKWLTTRNPSTAAIIFLLLTLDKEGLLETYRAKIAAGKGD